MLTYRPGYCNGWILAPHETKETLSVITFLASDIDPSSTQRKEVLCPTCLADIKKGRLFELAQKLGKVTIEPLEDTTAQMEMEL